MRISLLTSIALAAFCSSAGAVITYVDAELSASPSSNTIITGGGAVATGNLGGWGTRGANAVVSDGSTDTSNFANEGNVFESLGEGGSELTTTISGLDAGTPHEVYAFFWAATNDFDWDIQAGLTSGGLAPFFPGEAGVTKVDATTGPNVVGLNVLGQGADDYTDWIDGNRELYYVSLGVVPAGATSIDVFIDDIDRIVAVNDERTWYDGVGFEPVPEPSAGVLAALGLVGLLRRRR